ncbi:MAG: hypothetical protein ACP6IS_10055 [Candidatus Asgardarchaeia archaeon]
MEKEVSCKTLGAQKWACIYYGGHPDTLPTKKGIEGTICIIPKSDESGLKTYYIGFNSDDESVSFVVPLTSIDIKGIHELPEKKHKTIRRFMLVPKRITIYLLSIPAEEVEIPYELKIGFYSEDLLNNFLQKLLLLRKKLVKEYQISYEEKREELRKELRKIEVEHNKLIKMFKSKSLTIDDFANFQQKLAEVKELINNSYSKSILEKYRQTSSELYTVAKNDSEEFQRKIEDIENSLVEIETELMSTLANFTKWLEDKIRYFEGELNTIRTILDSDNISIDEILDQYSKLTRLNQELDNVLKMKQLKINNVKEKYEQSLIGLKDEINGLQDNCKELVEKVVANEEKWLEDKVDAIINSLPTTLALDDTKVYLQLKDNIESLLNRIEKLEDILTRSSNRFKFIDPLFEEFNKKVTSMKERIASTIALRLSSDVDQTVERVKMHLKTLGVML